MGDIEKVEVDDRKSRTIFQGKHSTALFLSRSTMDIGRIYNRAFSVKSIMSILIRPPAGVQQWKTTEIIQFWDKADVSAVVLCDLQEFPTKLGRNDLIRIQCNYPVSGSLLLGKIPGRVRQSFLFVQENLGSKRMGNFDRPVIAVHVNNNDFVNPGCDGTQRVPYVLLFIKRHNTRRNAWPHVRNGDLRFASL